jgi:hypothetical protein
MADEPMAEELIAVAALLTLHGDCMNNRQVPSTGANE